MPIFPFVTSLSDNIDRLFQILNHFKPDKDLAYTELTDALNEVSKTIEMMNKSINSFTETIFIDSQVNPDYQIHNHQQYSKLREFLTGEMLNQMEQGRGHSSRIATIYDEHLDKKLHAVLDNDKYEAFRQFFDDLSMSDYQIIDATERLYEWLENASQDVLQSYKLDDTHQANSKINSYGEDILDDQRLLNESMRKLTRIKFQFSTS